MRLGTLGAGFLTAAGLAELDQAFNVFSMPFFFESDEEEAAVEKKLTPIFEQRLNAKGFHLLGWGTGGWIQVFSKKPIRSLAVRTVMAGMSLDDWWCERGALRA